jgi:hypothetical protein
MSDLQSQNETPEEIAKRIEKEINQPLPKAPDIDLPKVVPDVQLPPINQPINPQPNIGGVGLPPVMAPQTNSMAIISLVAGILGWVAIPVIASIIAVILGIKARNDIKASNGTQTGDGMALTGIILGASSLAVVCLAAICFGISLIGAAAASGA